MWGWKLRQFGDLSKGLFPLSPSSLVAAPFLQNLLKLVSLLLKLLADSCTETGIITNSSHKPQERMFKDNQVCVSFSRPICNFLGFLLVEFCFCSAQLSWPAYNTGRLHYSPHFSYGTPCLRELEKSPQHFLKDTSFKQAF